MSQTIICPNCNTSIDLDKIADQKYSAILKEQEKKLKQEQEKQKEIFEKQLEDEKKEMREKAKKFAEEQVEKERKKAELEIKDMQEQLKKAEKEKEEAKKLELEILKKARDLEDKEKNFELEMQKKLLIERKNIEKDLEKKLEEKQELEMKMKLEKIQEQQEKLRKEEQENFRKKEQELLKQQEQMKKALDEAKRKAEQGSQQIQGDIQENDIRDALKQAFPIDDIEDVPTWVKWADLIQTVKNNIGQKSWIIVWESKNTKTWTNNWIMKLKEDKLKVKWNIAILVTTVLPKEIENFGMLDDVMVCLPKYVIPVCAMLREKLIAVSKTEKSLQWKDIKMEMLYKYLSSEEFSSKISMMVDVFSQLKSWIDSERRAMEKNWKKREKDLERATFAITWIYGELESLMGQELAWSEKLALESGEEE